MQLRITTVYNKASLSQSLLRELMKLDPIIDKGPMQYRSKLCLFSEIK